MPINCFIDSTAYKDYYVVADEIKKLEGIRPTDQSGFIPQKFRGSSMYNN